MKTFLIYYEPWHLRLQLPESTLVVAESEEKAKTYFRKFYDARMISIKPIKQH